jgi:hypothetical protein
MSDIQRMITAKWILRRKYGLQEVNIARKKWIITSRKFKGLYTTITTNRHGIPKDMEQRIKQKDKCWIVKCRHFKGSDKSTSGL